MNEPDPEILIKMVTTRMPFGKYKGTLVCDLPVSYLEWFDRKGYPAGKMGQLLATMHVVRQEGLTQLLTPLKAKYQCSR